jgi:hypothetical protein
MSHLTTPSQTIPPLSDVMFAVHVERDITPRSIIIHAPGCEVRSILHGTINQFWGENTIPASAFKGNGLMIPYSSVRCGIAMTAIIFNPTNEPVIDAFITWVY